MRTNTATKPIRTHEGAKAKHITAEQQLRRSVMSCMLWEREFYEEGEEIASRIARLVSELPAETVSTIAIEARESQNLRHVPLLICAAMAKHHKGKIVAHTIANVIRRADELAEFVSIVCKINGRNDAKKVLSAQAKKGLAAAFVKFDEYQLAKYSRDGAIKLRDVLFMCHAKPKNEPQAEVWNRLINGTLQTPDTWEVALSGGADKRVTFERLIREENIGYLAILRNLRNMLQSGVDRHLIVQAIRARKGADKVLPFRFVAAARHAMELEPVLDEALIAGIESMPNLPGKTIVLVDVSGSMGERLSSKSDLTRMDAAAALASIIKCDSLRVFTFSHNLVEVPPRRGMAGIDAVVRSQPHGGTYLGAAMQEINKIPHDRLVVITDEQSHDGVRDPVCNKAYLINVASNRNGVGYGRWTHIDGFSESVLSWIHAAENPKA
jgi:60 kDa SS-A/Ro ribonucleoprotein